jgi:hypothetical protein
VPGVAPSDLGDIMVEAYRYNEPIWREYPEPIFQRLLKDYQSRSLSQAKTIDQKSFTKDGITHAVGSILPLRPHFDA